MTTAVEIYHPQTTYWEQLQTFWEFAFINSLKFEDPEYTCYILGRIEQLNKVTKKY